MWQTMLAGTQPRKKENASLAGSEGVEKKQ